MMVLASSNRTDSSLETNIVGKASEKTQKALLFTCQMNSTLASLCPPSYALVLIVYLGLFLSAVKSSSDYSTLVYKDCATQTFTAPTSSQSETQTLSSLFQALVAHSSQSKFFKTIEGDSETAISGLFQCREDSSDEECYSCVNALTQMSKTLCSDAMAARVQLSGCYAHYKAEGFLEAAGTSKTNLLHKTCGEKEVGVDGLVEHRDAAFAALVNGVLTGNGFCATTFESVQVVAQCEGDLGPCECGECVSSAEQMAQEECGGSVWGEIYLDNCFITYKYFPDGIPGNNGGGNNNNNGNGKVTAIVVGGAAALILAFIFFSFLKSWGKKEDD